MADLKLFSFAEIIPKGVSFVRMVDERLFVAADLMILGTAQTWEEGVMALQSLPRKSFSESMFVIRFIPAIGNGHVKTVDFDRAAEIIMAMPGRQTRSFRLKFPEIIKRFRDGDRSLVQAFQAIAEPPKFDAQLVKFPVSSLGPSYMSSLIGSCNDNLQKTFDARAAQLDARKAQLDVTQARLDQQRTELDALAADLDSKQAKLDAHEAELDGKQAELDAFAAELDGKQAKLDALAAELDRKRAELDSRETELDTFADEIKQTRVMLEDLQCNLDQRDVALDGRDKTLSSRESDALRRESELDQQENRVEEKRVMVLRKLAAESDKNLALLEARKSEIAALAEENDAKYKQIKEELDKRAAALDERASELDQPDPLPVVVAEEIHVGRKRTRATDFSLFTKLAVELKKIKELQLDSGLEEELKQRMFAVLEGCKEEIGA